jgi:FKBP-type peptidyl-prolyl cis-trans isomerase FklB
MLKLFLLFITTITTANAGGPNSAGLAFLKANAAKEGVVSLPSGVQYKVLKKGSGNHHPTVNSPCETHYEGKLITGKVFDSSYARGSPTTFAPNQVIKGWTEIMQLMVEGDQWEVYIPSDKAYGDSGSGADIKGGDTLIFKMEIITIKGDKVAAFTCDPKTQEGCNDKEKKYIQKKSDKTADQLAKEVERLSKMKGKKMKPENMAWLDRRVHILGRMQDEL